MAAIQITSANNNRIGISSRAIVRTTAGIPYVVLEDTSDGAIEVWKGNGKFPTSFTEQDTSNNPTSSGRYGNPSCAIDTNNIIHIIYADDNGATPNYRYVKFDTSSDTFTGDEAITNDVGEDMTTNVDMHCDIAIDSSNIPHVVYVGFYNSGISSYKTVYYNNRIGGSWNTSPGYEIRGGSSSVSCAYCAICMDTSDRPVIAHSQSGTNRMYFWRGNANDPSTWENRYQAVGTGSAMGCSMDGSGNYYSIFYYATNTYYTGRKLKDGLWSSYSNQVIANYAAGEGAGNAYADGANDIYFFFCNSSNGVSYRKMSSGTFSSVVNVETGTFGDVSARGATWADNDSQGALVTPSPYSRRAGYDMDYVYADETSSPDIFFNYVTLQTPPSDNIKSVGGIPLSGIGTVGGIPKAGIKSIGGIPK